MAPDILLDSWAAWVAALAAPLYRRSATSWWRAARLTTGLRSDYYLLDVIGRKADHIAVVLLRLVADKILAQGPLFTIDDTRTKWYGPKVQGAGVHHNPTPRRGRLEVPLRPQLGQPYSPAR